MSFWTPRDLKRILSRLVTSIEVHEEPRPGRKRPGAKLLVRGSLEALLQLTGKVTPGGSPGGTSTLVATETPPQECRLQGRRHQSEGSVDEWRRAVAAM